MWVSRVNHKGIRKVTALACAHVWDLKTTALERLHVCLANMSEIMHFARKSLEPLKSSYH